MADLSSAPQSPLTFVGRESLAAVVAFFRPVTDAWTSIRGGADLTSANLNEVDLSNGIMNDNPTNPATQAADAERALLDAGYHYARVLVSLRDHHDQAAYSEATARLIGAAADLMKEELRQARRRKYPDEVW